jgi:hypothetical protein
MKPTTIHFQNQDFEEDSILTLLLEPRKLT